jgi:hypothetical protein
MSEDFIPYRRNINWHSCIETPIAQMIKNLSFIKDKRSWGYQFRFGFFEIPQYDFELISTEMLKQKR